MIDPSRKRCQHFAMQHSFHNIRHQESSSRFLMFLLLGLFKMHRPRSYEKIHTPLLPAQQYPGHARSPPEPMDCVHLPFLEARSTRVILTPYGNFARDSFHIHSFADIVTPASPSHGHRCKEQSSDVPRCKMNMSSLLLGLVCRLHADQQDSLAFTVCAPLQLQIRNCIRKTRLDVFDDQSQIIFEMLMLKQPFFPDCFLLLELP